MKKFFYSLLVVASVFAIASCGDKKVEDETPAAEVTLNPTTVSVEVGATAVVTATTNQETISATVEPATVAKATVNGTQVTVEGLAAGEATLTVTAGDATATAKVTVTEPEPVSATNVAFKMSLQTSYTYRFDQPTELSQFTMEWRFRKNGNWHTDGISNRLGNLSDVNEQGIMLRFNDDGGKHVGSEDWGLLQVVSSVTGGFYIGKNTSDAPESAQDGIECFKFMKDTWYTLSFVGDGENLTVYVDGEQIAQKAYPIANATINFQQYEQGMSWTEGPVHDSLTDWPYRQLFDGDLAFIRVWNVARTPAQLKETVCQANGGDGLVVNWAFNVGEGHVVPNLAGNNVYDLDFSKGFCNVSEYDATNEAAKSWVETETCPAE